MYSAWLEKTNGTWTRTNRLTELLDHEGSFIVCEEEADEELVVENVAAETGKYAIRSWDTIKVSDVPYFIELSDEAVNLAKNGLPCRVQHVSGCFTISMDGKKVQCFLKNPERRGLCIVNGDELIFDLDLWTKCKTRKERLEKKRIENPDVNANTFFSVASKLANNIGISRMQGFMVEHFLAWIAAHDNLKGRRATNREIKWLAKAWLKNSEGNKKHYRRWVAEEVLEQLDARFRKVVKSPKSE